jgi:hypothetical protein
MTERTVTEQQVIDAMNKYGSQEPIGHFAFIYDELFPELPKVGELIKPWDHKLEPDIHTWRPFHGISENGNVQTLSDIDCVVEWLYYRRQTPAERGEG